MAPMDAGRFAAPPGFEGQSAGPAAVFRPRCFEPGVLAAVFRSRCFCPIAKNSTAAMAPSFRGPARGVRSAAPGRFSPGPGLGRAPSPDRLLPVGLVTPPHQCLAVFLSNSRLFSPPVIITADSSDSCLFFEEKWPGVKIFILSPPGVMTESCVLTRGEEGGVSWVSETVHPQQKERIRHGRE